MRIFAILATLTLWTGYCFGDEETDNFIKVPVAQLKCFFTETSTAHERFTISIIQTSQTSGKTIGLDSATEIFVRNDYPFDGRDLQRQCDAAKIQALADGTSVLVSFKTGKTYPETGFFVRAKVF